MKHMLPGRLRIRAAVFVCVAAAALALDRVTKLWALSALADGRTVVVIPHLLSFTLLHNPGASLGVGSSTTWLISVLAIVASVALIIAMCRTSSLRWTLMLALAFAGACGNLVDRISYANGLLNGRVVDFLNYGWSIGNVADIWLVIAGAAMIGLILVGEPFVGGSADAREGRTDTRPDEHGVGDDVDGPAEGTVHDTAQGTDDGTANIAQGTVQGGPRS